MLSKQELKSSTRKELLDELTEAQATMMKKRITTKTKHEKDTSSVKKQRRHIARTKTFLRDMELEEAAKNSVKIS